METKELITPTRKVGRPRKVDETELSTAHLTTSKRLFHFITTESDNYDNIFSLVEMLAFINGSLDELLDLRIGETMYFTNPLDENIKGIIKRMEND